uniref:Uncharacterized protein n=1 Tax=Arundo donax TaxID=35708 RepID=A0A0A8ZDR9_ARUDO
MIWSVDTGLGVTEQVNITDRFLDWLDMLKLGSPSNRVRNLLISFSHARKGS